MKLFLMKLCSLLVLLAGVLLLVWALNLGPIMTAIRTGYDQALNNGTIPPAFVQIIAAAVMIIVGFIAFMPKLTGGSMRRSVVIPTDHGNVAVQLEALRPALLKVLRKMPEIRRVHLKLKPTKGRQKVHIVAHIQLRQQVSLDVHQHVDIVAAHIADSTVRLLGLEDIAEVEVIIDGINVNAKEAARAVQQEAENFRAHLASQAKTEQLAVAAASAAAALDHVAVAAQQNEEAPFATLDEPHRETHVAGAPPVAEPALLVEEEPYVEWADGEASETGEIQTPGFESENLEPLQEIESVPLPDVDATLNRDEADVTYAFPPLSEQEEDEAENIDQVEDFDSAELAEQHKFNSGTDHIGENDVEEEREEEEEGATLTGSAPQVDDLAWSPFNDAAQEEADTTDDEPGAFAAVFDDESPEAEARVAEGAGNDEPDEGTSDKKRWSFF